MPRLKTIPVALLVLALSATAVYAAGQGHAVGPSHNPAVSSAEPTEASAASEVPELDGSAAPSHPANHGGDVSTAARTATPDGYDNHGQWVSSVAKDNHGHNKGNKSGTEPEPSPGP